MYMHFTLLALQLIIMLFSIVIYEFILLLSIRVTVSYQGAHVKQLIDVISLIITSIAIYLDRGIDKVVNGQFLLKNIMIFWIYLLIVPANNLSGSNYSSVRASNGKCTQSIIQIKHTCIH